MNDVATGSSQGDQDDDNASDICLLSARDDGSLSSVDDDDDDDMGADNPTSPVESSLDSMTRVWGNPGTPLYQAMQVLVNTARTTDSCRLPTPSALQADAMSQVLHEKVNQLFLQEQDGTTTAEQRELWKKATDEQQHEWIASFFLAASS
jgi:hypothetical protein